ncbi:MAG: hypothetical protein MUC59_19640 [Saprospiraceae bacterium]|jgi:chromosome segregation ATPase|nr:hypothetical protein [Saprospiraceae bacterium]
MFTTILQKAGEKIFEELMKGKVTELESRIKELEGEVAELKRHFGDIKNDVKDVEDEMKQTYKTTSKMEGMIQTLLMFGSQQKKLEDGNEQ